MGAGWRRVKEQVRRACAQAAQPRPAQHHRYDWRAASPALHQRAHKQLSASAGARAQDADFALRTPGPQVKQNWNLTDKNFVATSNSRNENMLREAGEFAGHLKRCEKEIRTLKNATEGAPVPNCSCHASVVDPRPAASRVHPAP